MSLKANLIRAVITVGTTLAAIFATAHSAFPVAIVLCILAVAVSFFLGTGIGLEVDDRDMKRRHRAPLDRVTRSMSFWWRK